MSLVEFDELLYFIEHTQLYGKVCSADMLYKYSIVNYNCNYNFNFLTAKKKRLHPKGAAKSYHLKQCAFILNDL